MASSSSGDWLAQPPSPKPPSITEFFRTRPGATTVDGHLAIHRTDLRQLVLTIYKAIPALGRLAAERRLPRQADSIWASLVESKAGRGEPVLSVPGPLPTRCKDHQAIPLPDVVAWLWDVAATMVDTWLARNLTSREHAGEILDERNWNLIANLLIDALPGIQDDAKGKLLEPTATQDCVEHIALLCACACGVDIEHELLLEHIAPICMSAVEPTEFLAKTVCRSCTVREVLGTTLSKVLRAYVHSEQFVFPQTLHTNDMVSELSQELVHTKQELTRLRAAAAASPSALPVEVVGQSLVLRGPAKRSRADVRMDKKTAWVEFVMKCNLAFKHAPKTAAVAEQLVAFGRSGDSDGIHDALEHCLGRETVRSHMSLVDLALDSLVQERLNKAVR